MKKIGFGSIEHRYDGRYRARFNHRGQPHQKTFASHENAQAWLLEQYTHIKTNRFEIARESQSLTFAEALDRYEREVTPTKRGADHEKSTLKVIRHFGSPLLHRPLADLLQRDMLAYREARLKSPCVRWGDDGYIVQYDKMPSPATVRKELSLISNLFTVAITEWNCNTLSNPVSRGVRPRTTRSIVRRITPSEFQMLLAEARRYEQATPNSRVPISYIISFALTSAMRLGEIGRMRWERVDFVRNTIHCGIGKNNYIRTVPLSANARQVLQLLEPQEEGPVWGVDSESIRNAWNRVVKRAHLEGLRFHDLRHEAISTLVEHAEQLEMSLPEIMAVSGHRSWEAFQVYVHAMTPRLARKMQRDFGWSMPETLTKASIASRQSRTALNGELLSLPELT